MQRVYRKLGSLSTVIRSSHNDCRFGADLHKALIKDVEGLATMVTANLPDEFVKPFSKAMMPPLMSRVRELWLDRAIPPSLEDMGQYKSSLAQVHQLADKLDALCWPGTETLHDWGNNAPRIWLNKRKETELDRTRNEVSDKIHYFKRIIVKRCGTSEFPKKHRPDLD